jgi:hypothetical protein
MLTETSADEVHKNSVLVQTRHFCCRTISSQDGSEYIHYCCFAFVRGNRCFR